MDSKETITEVMVTVNFKNFHSVLGIFYEYNPMTTFCISPRQFKIFSSLNQTIAVNDFKYNSIIANQVVFDDKEIIGTNHVTEFEVIQYTINVGTMIKKLNACLKSTALLLRFYSNNKFYISSAVNEFKHKSQITTSIKFGLETNSNYYTSISDYCPERGFDVSENLDILIGLLKSIEASKDIRGTITKFQFTLETIGEQTQVVHTINKNVNTQGQEPPDFEFKKISFKIQKENLMKLKGFKKKVDSLKIILAIDQKNNEPIGLVFEPKLNGKHQLGKIKVMIRFDEISVEY
ncbi:late transcription factor VLTF-1 [Salmon gill poxvirus]|nr:late transcription factor VLTF-1 [Salmon gill poxvirus]